MPIHDWTRVNAGIFHDFHHEWISSIKRALNSGLLPPDYYAMAEQIAGGLGPDVLTLEAPHPGTAGNGGATASPARHGAVQLATGPPKVRFTATSEPERYARKAKMVTIRHSSDDRVIAVAEIVSPGNKASRHPFGAFVRKALEFLDAGIHLLIIDLFPPGERDPQGIHAAIWEEWSGQCFKLPPDRQRTLVAYAAREAITAYIEPVAVGDLLPNMPLFLEPDLYVPVPLEAAYCTAIEDVPRRWREVLEAPPP